MKPEFIGWRHTVSITLVAALTFGVAHSQTEPNKFDDHVAPTLGNHDLSLPNWGPYTKNYIGVSHIPNPAQGLRFDLSVFPALYRRKSFVPDVTYDSGFHPWRASPDLEFFEFRHEIEWKDRVFSDIAYAEFGESARIVATTFTNNTDLKQSLSMHLMASMHFPSLKPYAPNTPLLLATVQLPEHGKWIDALDYVSLEYATPRPQDNLVYDGWLRGEIRDHLLVKGTAVGQDFGRDTGDQLVYDVDIERPIPDAVLVIRYRTPRDIAATLQFDGLLSATATLSPTQDIQLATVPIGAVLPGKSQLTLTAAGDGEIEIDGFSVVAANEVNSILFDVPGWNPVPKIQSGPTSNSVVLTYEDSPTQYGIRWYFDKSQVREVRNGTLSGFFEKFINNHMVEVMQGDDLGHYTDIYLRPIVLDAHSSRTIYAVVTAGSVESIDPFMRSLPDTSVALRDAVAEAAATLPLLPSTTAGKKYRFSVERLAATLATNVVYPVYTQRQYIRHSAPGRWWDSLYTWDSGFIGLGLLELDTKRSIETLSAYLTPDNAQSAFIHHGTPLPVQHYLFYELWNRTQSIDLVKQMYPGLRRYYRFLSGRDGSTTNKHQTELLQTWDYFYNSGGWDDLPPQKYVHEHDLTANVTPVVTTAHVIRIAKIMRTAASALNLSDDVALYSADIDKFSEALQKYAWDDNAGYFSYVHHDNTGRATGHLRLPNGENLNKTLDGVSPLVAGITTVEQTESILKKLRDREQLSSPVGIPAVDQSASYYSSDGYWNGTVWMPHQWFMWKSMLDIGENSLAHDIASTALDTWKAEVDASYVSPEHFVIESGRGAGWHQFGALSSPILSWYAAYFSPGTLTTGYDTLIEELHISDDLASIDASLRIFENVAAKETTVLFVLDEKSSYRVTWNGLELQTTEYSPGTYSVQIPRTKSHGRLVIVARSNIRSKTESINN